MWRHNNILTYITNNINDKKYKVYNDIDHSKTINWGTIPPYLIVTPLRHDIVTLNENNVHIFELTVPFETNIKQRDFDKTNKYSHHCADITVMTTRVKVFEMCSRGLITSWIQS